MKTPKPASLSSSLLARQGEARPAAPGESEGESETESEVRAQQDEIEARLSGEISREESASTAAAGPAEGEAGEPALGGESGEPTLSEEPEAEGVTLAEWAQRSSVEADDLSGSPADERPVPETGGESTFRVRGFLIVIVAAVLGSALGLWLGTGSRRAELPPPPAAAPEATPAAPMTRGAASRDVAVSPLGPAAPRTPENVEPRPPAGAGAPASETALTGIFAVQVVSARSRAAAESEWVRLAQKHAALLGAAPHEIARAEIEGRGTFYRLRVGNFEASSDARDLCGALKALGQDCLVVKR